MPSYQPVPITDLINNPERRFGYNAQIGIGRAWEATAHAGMIFECFRPRHDCAPDGGGGLRIVSRDELRQLAEVREGSFFPSDSESHALVHSLSFARTSSVE